MANYDFSTLNDRDLEVLVRDLLSRKLGMEFQAFKPGPDQGIDLRYSTPCDDNEIVVQVKHFLNSGIVKLKSHLRNSEVKKVAKLAPQRYIFCTSLALSPKDKDDIKKMFEPFIKSMSDILGFDELNKWLDDYPDIHDRHVKLWLCSFNVLKKIVENGVKGRSEFFSEKIKAEIKVFVPNHNHGDAVKTLNKNHFILITGAPGVGKTTLANFLTYQLLAEGFEMVFVREIREAEDAYKVENRQIFYFDDFLGAITLDLYSSRNADSAIVNFINRIKHDSKKRLIVTCRTSILNQAKAISDNIQNSDIDVSNFEVRVESYTDWEKAQILYSHIFVSEFSEEQREIFFKDKFYWRVIRHRNYNPRMIAAVTNPSNFKATGLTVNEVLRLLEEPARLWERPFKNQISRTSRLLLYTIFSLSGGARVLTEDKLENAFKARIDYEVANNNYQREGDEYKLALKELGGAFINRIIDNNYTKITFFNPSIADYIFSLFEMAPEEYLTVLNSGVYFEQFKDRITTDGSGGEKRISFLLPSLYKKLYDIFSQKKNTLNGYYFGMPDLYTASILVRLFSSCSESIMNVIAIVNGLTCSQLTWEDCDNLVYILNYLAVNGLTSKLDRLPNLLLLLSKDIRSYYILKSVSGLIKGNKVYYEFVDNWKTADVIYYNEMQKNIDSFWVKEMNKFMNDFSSLDIVLERAELLELVKNRKNEASQINLDMGMNISPAIVDYVYDVDSKLLVNREANKGGEIEIRGYGEFDSYSADEIDFLFNCRTRTGLGGGSDNARVKIFPFNPDDL